MIERLDWPSPTHWLEWVRSRSRSDQRVLAPGDAPADLQSLADDALGTKARLYVGRQRPSLGEGWEYPPHQHPFHDYFSLVHYLTPGRTPLVVTDGPEGRSVTLHYMKAGDTVRFRNDVWHTAAKHAGPDDRLFIVAVGGHYA